MSGRLEGFQERCQDEVDESAIFEDVSNEIAIFGTQEGVLNPRHSPKFIPPDKRIAREARFPSPA